MRPEEIEAGNHRYRDGRGMPVRVTHLDREAGMLTYVPALQEGFDEVPVTCRIIDFAAHQRYAIPAELFEAVRARRLTMREVEQQLVAEGKASPDICLNLWDPDPA